MKIETVAIKSLTLDPENARKHSSKNIEAIASSLKSFGQRRPIVAYNNIVIAGNGTIEAATNLGWTDIAVVRCPSEWTHEQARAYALADNRTSELGIWDHQLLADQLLELDAQGWQVEELGFVQLSPPTDPYKEWDAMPAYEQPDKTSAFRVTVHFATESDADDFFLSIDRPKRSYMWWPQDDGHVGSDVTVREVLDID